MESTFTLIECIRELVMSFDSDKGQDEKKVYWATCGLLGLVCGREVG